MASTPVWETAIAKFGSGSSEKLEREGWEPFGAYYMPHLSHVYVVYRRRCVRDG